MRSSTPPSLARPLSSGRHGADPILLLAQVSIIILAGVVVALLTSRCVHRLTFASSLGQARSRTLVRPSSRSQLSADLDSLARERSFFYIRRYYAPTLRSYFIPAKGIRIRRLGIYIRGPPERIPREPPPSYDIAAHGGRRRRRRGRQTVGETVGDGGVRLGERDVDDGWDDLDLVERGARPNDELPRYTADNGLPMYTVGDGSAAEEAERIRARALADGLEDVLPTAAEYEAASRNHRDGAVTRTDVRTEPDGAPAYPPTVHLADSRRPPLNPRTTTARSSLLLSAFTRRAPSPAPSTSSSPAPPRHPPASPRPHDYPPRPSTSSDTLDSPDHHPAVAGTLRRSASSATSTLTSGSSSSSEAGKAGEERKTKRRDDDDAGDGAAEASSSTLKLEAKEGERRDGDGDGQ